MQIAALTLLTLIAAGDAPDGLDEAAPETDEAPSTLEAPATPTASDDDARPAYALHVSLGFSRTSLYLLHPDVYSTTFGTISRIDESVRAQQLSLSAEKAWRYFSLVGRLDVARTYTRDRFANDGTANVLPSAPNTVWTGRALVGGLGTLWFNRWLRGHVGGLVGTAQAPSSEGTLFGFPGVAGVATSGVRVSVWRIYLGVDLDAAMSLILPFAVETDPRVPSPADLASPNASRYAGHVEVDVALRGTVMVPF